jgi:CHAD domain-containing protein/phosphohistidine phosphatase SixA
MYLVFLRHAQAEDATEDMEDADRHLTKAGRRAMRATLPSTLGLLPSSGDITVLTSPLVRASETADIFVEAVKETLGKNRLASKEPIPFEPLAGGSIGDVLYAFVNHAFGSPEPLPSSSSSHEWGSAATVMPLVDAPATSAGGRESSAASSSDGQIVVFVGHNPHITDLARHLTGASVNFKKGAVMCTRLDHEATISLMQAATPDAAASALAGAAQLRWFVQGPAYKRWKTLMSLEEVLADGFESVSNEYDRFIDNPNDADAVHDLRVSIRTLRSLVSFVEPFQKSSQNHDLQQGLHAIVIQLSRLREYDVLIKEAKKVDVDLMPTAEGVVPLKKLDKELQERRNRERDRTLHEFSRHRFDKRFASLAHEFGNIKWRERIEHEGLDASDLARRLDQMTDAFIDAYTNLDLADVERTHKVRKQAKQVRYVTKGLKPMLGERPDMIAELKGVQDTLGELCDARVNADLLKEVSQHGRKLSEIAQWQANNLVVQQQDTESRIIRDLSKTEDGE